MPPAASADNTLGDPSQDLMGMGGLSLNDTAPSAPQTQPSQAADPFGTDLLSDAPPAGDPFGQSGFSSPLDGLTAAPSAPAPAQTGTDPFASMQPAPSADTFGAGGMGTQSGGSFFGG